ncbi:MAG TPA: hypothetical protein VGG26_08750 [Terracidiphilus sp.]|jgi:hypothetical protein
MLGLGLLAAALAAAAVPARAEQDAVQFFHNITVTTDTPVHDAVCFFCSVHLDGNAMGDIVVFFGNVSLDGDAHHDVVSFFGHVSAAGHSSIGGDLVAIFGSVRLGDEVSVGRDMICLFGDVRAPSSVRVRGNRVGIPGLFLSLPLIVILLVVMLIARELRSFRRRRYMAGGYPFPPGR